ncbi:MAG: glycosyltransferase family 2 protein [Thermomicrobiaceae bacterium]
MQQPGWDAIIVNFNGALFLDPCLRALTRMASGPTKIIVVDNASTDDSINELAGWPQADVLQMGVNLGYAGGANAGAAVSEAPVMVFLNPDVELDSDYGRNLVQNFWTDETLGSAGAKLRFPDSELIQHAGGRVHWPELTTSHIGESEPDTDEVSHPRDVDYVTGAALAVRRSAFDEIGGFDDGYFPAYWEDVDL